MIWTLKHTNTKTWSMIAMIFRSTHNVQYAYFRKFSNYAMLFFSNISTAPCLPRRQGRHGSAIPDTDVTCIMCRKIHLRCSDLLSKFVEIHLYKLSAFWLRKLLLVNGWKICFELSCILDTLALNFDIELWYSVCFIKIFVPRNRLNAHNIGLGNDLHQTTGPYLKQWWAISQVPSDVTRTFGVNCLSEVVNFRQKWD